MTLTVRVWGGLQIALGGNSVLELDGETLADVFDALEARFPAFDEELQDQTAVAVDGTIWRDQLDVPLQPGSELYLMPRLEGG